jgi:hypothetical protein
VGGPHHAEADRDRGARDLLHVEQLERHAGAHDVDDGVDAAHLVEVHLLGRAPVEAALGDGERREDGGAALLDPIGQPGLGDEALDVRGGAHHRGVGVDVDLGAGDAAAQNGLHLQLPAVHGERRAGAHLVEVGAGVDQRAERHVAGDAGEAVEPGGGHRDAASLGAGSEEQPGDRAGGAVPVVDADHRDARGA